MIIAIDGPSASGKGTIARALAAHFNLPYLDTGALYRAVTLTLLREGAQPESREAAIRIAGEFSKGIPPELLTDPDLRLEEVSKASAMISAIPQVRKYLFDLQRDFIKRTGGAVLDGRDIGTVIAPEADIKIYVTATPEKRAERRWKELQSRGQKATYEAVLKELQARDKHDASRATAPAKQAPDAVLLDNSQLPVDQSIQAAMRIVLEKTGRS